tara:strand:+ start:559 stop:1023 length:465 start_codon:yes stop_codon:yes gene_type:complete
MGAALNEGGFWAVLVIGVFILKIYASYAAKQREKEEAAKDKERRAKVEAGQLELQTDQEFVQSVDAAMGKQYVFNALILRLAPGAIILSLFFAIFFYPSDVANQTFNETVYDLAWFIFGTLTVVFVLYGIVWSIFSKRQEAILEQAKAMKNGGE